MRKLLLVGILLISALVYSFKGGAEINDNRGAIVTIGNITYSMKTLNGLFFENDEGDVLLLSGTETTEGAQSEAFVYDVTNKRMINSMVIEGASSFTAFCISSDNMHVVYFGTISRSTESGSYLFSYNYHTDEFKEVHHFNEKGIYSIACSGEIVYVATSQDIALYEYNTEVNTCKVISKCFTDQPFAYSVVIDDNYAFLGIGTKPALIKIDLDTGETIDLLPTSYSNDSSVLGLTKVGGSLYFLLSPSYTVLEVDLDSERVKDTGLKYRQSSICTINKEELDNVYDFYGDLLCEYKNGMEIISNGDRNSYFRINNKKTEVYGLSISGFVRILINGKEESCIDLCNEIQKSYSIPRNCIIVDDCVYAPGRRFQVYDINSGLISSNIVKDEPQAACYYDNCLYTANYTDCTVYEYPIEELKSKNNVVAMNDSKYLLVDVDNQCRPSSMCVSEDGHYLILGSGPLYGKWGGACTAYDLREHQFIYTEENVINKHLIQTVCGSLYDSNLVWLGTSPYGENTSPVYLEDESSHLILWDIQNRKKILDLIPEQGMRKIGCVVEDGETVYCITQAAHLVTYNAKTGEQRTVQEDGEITKIIIALDGTMYGISEKALYSIDRDSLDLTLLHDGFSFLSDLIEDPITGKIYVVDNTELKWVLAAD